MYRLLLVDDEREIVDWLYDLFQDVTDLELDVYKALSGFEALEILDRTKVDVVVSDIKMPGMSGLQLLEKIRSRWPACRVIFLTGYNEFDYVYTAIKCDGVGYLLKTEEDAEIVAQVCRAIAELEQSARNRDMMEKVQRYMGLAIPSIQRDVIKHVLLDPEGSSETTQDHLDEMQIPLRRACPVYLAAGRFDRMPADATPSFGVRVAASLRLRAEELFGGNFSHINLIHQGNIDLVWILQPAQGQSIAADDCDRLCVPLISGTLESLQDFSRQAFGLTASYAFLSKAVPWEDVESSYAMVAKLLAASAGIGGEAILNERNFTGLLGPEESAQPAIDGKRAADLKAMPAMLERGEREPFLQALDGLLECLRGAHGKNNAAAQEIYYTVAIMLLSQVNRRGAACRMPAGLDLGRLTRADVHGGWADAAQYLRAVSVAYFDLMRGEQESNVRESIELVQQYIRSHLSEDLSLMKLAELSYFNPSYLSRLFKQATGQNVTDYIASLRVGRAKELLRDYGKKIGDISASLGYESQHYFSRFFKKFTGMTPQEYRESLRIT